MSSLALSELASLSSTRLSGVSNSMTTS
jgi:hypothetical protein